MIDHSLPVVYSCSGCSDAAQMDNYMAIKLDRAGLAKMSCIAGVGGDVKKLVHTAKKAKEIIAIDGCPLACVKACLGKHGLAPTVYYQLSDMGVRKNDHEDFDTIQANELLQDVIDDLKQNK